MDNQRDTRPVPAWRVFWLGVAIVFLLDIVGHTIDLYWRGVPVTFQTIYAQGVRGLHAEAWVLGGVLVIGYGAFVARQAIGAILAGRKELADAVYRG